MPSKIAQAKAEKSQSHQRLAVNQAAAKPTPPPKEKKKPKMTSAQQTTPNVAKNLRDHRPAKQQPPPANAKPLPETPLDTIVEMEEEKEEEA